MNNYLDLTNSTVFITGGCGLLGTQHIEAILENGGTAVFCDINQKQVGDQVANFKNRNYDNIHGFRCDITKRNELKKISHELKNKGILVNCLVNNASINPTVSSNNNGLTPLELIEDADLLNDYMVSIVGALNCSIVFSEHMKELNKGVILNISSDLGVIAPNQDLYSHIRFNDVYVSKKPVQYSIHKFGLIGLTKYLATYWNNFNIRCNALAPGGVFNGQPHEFVEHISSLIPMKRMAKPNEYKAAVAFLCSEASSYFNGSVLIADGGRSVW